MKVDSLSRPAVREHRLLRSLPCKAALLGENSAVCDRAYSPGGLFLPAPPLPVAPSAKGPADQRETGSWRLPHSKYAWLLHHARQPSLRYGEDALQEQPIPPNPGNHLVEDNEPKEAKRAPSPLAQEEQAQRPEGGNRARECERGAKPLDPGGPPPREHEKAKTMRAPSPKERTSSASPPQRLARDGGEVEVEGELDPKQNRQSPERAQPCASPRRPPSSPV